MDNQWDLSIIIPIYNEEARIASSLLEIIQFLENSSYTYEIIIVDDGSTDNTEQVVKQISGDNTHFQYVRYWPNRGKGYAVRLGMLKAIGEYRLFTDADLSVPIEQLSTLMLWLHREYDLSIASRSDG